jgi:hypothetical protein
MPLAREIMDRFADGTLGRQPSLPQITDPA